MDGKAKAKNGRRYGKKNERRQAKIKGRNG